MTDTVRTAVIRTSDRQTFKRCRRKWGWHSGLRQNLTVTDNPSYFWLGTGGHYALEDYHGYNHHRHPAEAFRAYVDACKLLKRNTQHGLPDDYEEQTTLCEGILEYYLIWTKNRDPYKTVWIEDEPQVEITCQVELPVTPPPGYDRVVYQITLDRLVEIESEYWIVDYKFYKSFSSADLDFDQQMSAYIWNASTIYEVPIAGGILHEFRKALPNPPRILSSGKISTASAQLTTHGLYREALVEVYGSVEKATHAHIACLSDLAARESEERDDFIKRSRTRRTDLQQQAEGTKILMECEDMCNPDLPLYTNATRDCSWDCGLSEVCLMMDRDDDWEDLLHDTTITRTGGENEWRQYLKP